MMNLSCRFFLYLQFRLGHRHIFPGLLLRP